MEFNAQQLEVINHRDGPCLVTAVPGSGKTASLTERIKRLIDAGVDPRRILAITFTNKAAREMRSRIAKSVGQVAKKMTISTFHSLCARIIRRDPEALGLKRNFSIIDQDDQKRLVESCICKVKGYDKKKEIKSKDLWATLGHIEKTRNACDPGAAPFDNHWMPKVVEAYYKDLSEANSIDFTGLLTGVLRILETQPQLLSMYQSFWQYVNVDEVQDTNVCQYKILSLLAGKYRNILVVGDMDQSIYGFRDAEPQNVLNFEKDFSARVLKLETNYRSTPQILSPAHKLIKNNKLRKPTSLETGNPPGPPPLVMGCQSDIHMAHWIANFVRTRILSGTPPSEIAVFYRVNAASRILENAFRSEKIRYKVIGDVSFYDRQEIKTSLSILKIFANANDRIAFERTFDFCGKGVGARSMAKIHGISSERSIPIMCAAEEFAKGGSIQAAGVKRLLGILKVGSEMTPGKGLMHVVKESGFWNSMFVSDGKDRCENISELARDVEEYVASSEHRDVSKYLQEISLLSSSDEESDKEKVNLMTLHSSKGLEFDVVVISHCMQRIIPHERAMAAEDESEVEEERRLFYVGMTRARKSLALTYATSKTDQNGRRTDMEPSEFLYDAGLL